jgi:lipid A 3-O-deacylase
MRFPLLVAALIGVACILAFPPSGAQASDLPYGKLTPPAPPEPQNPLSGFELRLGGYSHDPQSPERGYTDLNVDILSPKLGTSSDYWWNLAIPRAHVGATVNFFGKTSVAYAGFAWDYDIYRGLFIEGSFDGAVNDGKTGPVYIVGFNSMGCPLTFHENVSLGYHLTEHWSLMGTLEHSSNANLCVQNRGLTNVGGRLGYTF